MQLREENQSMKKILFAELLFAVVANNNTRAHTFLDDMNHENVTTGNLEYTVEAQTSFSKGSTPLWLNANKYGLSSLDNNNGYLRGELLRSINNDADKKVGYGYGIDIAVPYNYTSSFVVQQAFVQGRWLHGTLTVGSKEMPMNLKNNSLSSGSQTFGKNARPIPQVRLALEDYWTIPLTGGWLQLRGHVAYGVLTDNSWQKDFTSRKSKYVTNTLYHSKSGFIRIGKEDAGMYPFSVEVGLEMATLFGGNSYQVASDGSVNKIVGRKDLKAFWNAFVPGGKDVTDGENYKNAEGDMLGSWMLRLNYEAPTWKAGLYMDKFFEDHSAMFLLDYDGYDKGDEWQVRKKNRYILYDLKDMMLGADINFKYGSLLKNIVVEYLYTKYQSGPIYHDHTVTIPDHIGGIDNYYNHNIYSGWQHWGQVMGNPLYRSPIYNTNGTINVDDNRFMAFHVGIDGNLSANASYRLLATYQEGLGTYASPYLDKRHNISFLAEAAYKFTGNTLGGWSVKCGYGMDFGGILGSNAGFQLTVSKKGTFSF